MVFQSYALFNHKTVAQNIKFGLEVGGRPIAVGFDCPAPPPSPCCCTRQRRGACVGACRHVSSGRLAA